MPQNTWTLPYNAKPQRLLTQLLGATHERWQNITHLKFEYAIQWTDLFCTSLPTAGDIVYMQQIEGDEHISALIKLSCGAGYELYSIKLMNGKQSFIIVYWSPQSISPIWTPRTVLKKRWSLLNDITMCRPLQTSWKLFLTKNYSRFTCTQNIWRTFEKREKSYIFTPMEYAAVAFVHVQSCGIENTKTNTSSRN